jgi:hypothetical protein
MGIAEMMAIRKMVIAKNFAMLPLAWAGYSARLIPPRRRRSATAADRSLTLLR